MALHSDIRADGVRCDRLVYTSHFQSTGLVRFNLIKNAGRSEIAKRRKHTHTYKYTNAYTCARADIYIYMR